MMSMKTSTLLSLTLFFTGAMALAPALAFAQRGSEQDVGACLGCGACGGGLTAIIAIPILLVVLNIALLVWVAKDAKSRGMDSSVLWMILVMFSGLIGLILYLFSRPQGNLVQCPSGQNRRMQVSAKCPHCGNA